MSFGIIGQDNRHFNHVVWIVSLCITRNYLNYRDITLCYSDYNSLIAYLHIVCEAIYISFFFICKTEYICKFYTLLFVYYVEIHVSILYIFSKKKNTLPTL